MVNCAFQGFLDINITTLIKGYVGRKPNWVFNYGSLWPQNSGTELFDDTIHNGVKGAWCDVFFKQAGNRGAGGGVSLNQWGDLTPFTSFANFNPGYYDGQITGITSFAQDGAFPTFISSYQYNIDLNSNSNYPSTLGQLPPQINPRALTSVPTGTIFPMMKFGGIVTMLDKRRVTEYYKIGAGNVQMIDSDGLILDLGPLPGGGSAVGGIGGGQFTPYNNGGGTHDQLGTYSLPPNPSSLSFAAITWDDAIINTYMQSQFDFIDSTVTPFGFLTFQFVAVPAVIAGRTFIRQPLVLTSYDGLRYWVINLVPGDADAALAAPIGNGVGAARTGHITPDGTFWFQNSVSNSALIFSGTFPVPGITYLNGIPIDLPYVPRLPQPLY
jgi:hypothetical protein